VLAGWDRRERDRLSAGNSAARTGSVHGFVWKSRSTEIILQGEDSMGNVGDLLQTAEKEIGSLRQEKAAREEKLQNLQSEINLLENQLGPVNFV
jgi:hypothetical protein